MDRSGGLPVPIHCELLTGINIADYTRLLRLDVFSEDADLRGLLLLDSLGIAADAPITSTGLVEDVPAVALQALRLWEYAWLFKALGLARGPFEVLDLGGPALHLVLLAALAGDRVTSLDISRTRVYSG